MVPPLDRLIADARTRPNQKGQIAQLTMRTKLNRSARADRHKRAKDLRARKLSDKDIIEQITSSNGDAHAVLREIAIGLDIGSAEIGNWAAKVRELGWARKVVPAPPLAEEDDHEIDDTDADLAVFDHEPEPASGTAQSFEVTLFRNAEGRITKRVELDDLGELNIDGAPTLWHGTARRVRYSSSADFAKPFE
jgi:hypothetical protein